ncbi:PAS-domain containing protein [Epibacterium ulvae]|uniref:hybrid sensor histidine kinase/response regulator n=1 Tax=Epibacterium ulvae TaxID=1156985 RepID=UPI001BFC516D|nr:PAS-domain containing protein [Epibacterium ulvae]MBT8155073.1 PAS-domain containing protein [Epibacterium ulvae]
MDRTDASYATMTQAGLNLIAQAMSIYDRDLCLAVCNQRFQDMFNLPEALVTRGAPFEDTIRFIAQSGDYGAIADLDAFVARRVAQAKTFDPHYFERARHNGQVISIEGSPLPEGGWVTVYTDITRPKRIEAMLRSRSEELSGQLIAHTEELSATNRKLAASNTALAAAKRDVAISESRIRLTTEMMPAHIAHLDERGFYTFTNRRLSSVFPGRPTEILGLHIAEALGISAFARIEPHLIAAYKGERPVFEFTEDHDSRRIRVALTPDGGGGVYVLSMDVTEETQARVALQQTRRRDMAAQMTNGLAHDFSNLLTVILGIQSKLSKMDLGAEATQLITATQSAAERGGRLLHRISQMTGQRPLRPQATILAALLEELKILASPSLPRGVGLSVINHTKPHALLLDAGKLQDALLNLILNARDACGASGQITVSAHEVGRTWIEISVIDTGPGFSPEALEQGLNPFFTTKGSNGSGLGLAMVYDMVKLNGGDVRLGNTISGASVTLRLPFRLAPDAKGGMALLVEDSEELRATYRDMLTDLGYSVIEAETANDGLALARDLPEIVLILSDVKLKGSETGLDLLDGLDRTRPWPPVILMTSAVTADPIFRSALKKAPVLQKPFTTAQLAALIRPETPT